MNILLACSIGLVTSASVYLILSKNMQRFLIGFILLTNAVNLAVLTASLRPDQLDPMLADPDGANALVDPLPQAFVLTAIVISLGTLSFLLAMVGRFKIEGDQDIQSK